MFLQDFLKIASEQCLIVGSPHLFSFSYDFSIPCFHSQSLIRMFHMKYETYIDLNRGLLYVIVGHLSTNFPSVSVQSKAKCFLKCISIEKYYIQNVIYIHLLALQLLLFSRFYSVHLQYNVQTTVRAALC